MKTHPRIIYSFLILAVAFGPGCSRNSSEGSARAVRVHLANEPMSLDPGLAEDGVSFQVLNNTWDGLVGYDAEGLLQNRLAESYSISTDRKRIEFKLRKDAKWSDGKPVEAQDFVAAFRRTLAPNSVSKLTPLFMSIRGAEAYHTGKKGWDEVGVRPGKDTSELVIELSAPTSFFLHTLTLPPTFPIRQELLDANSGRWPEDGPSTGPFVMSSHQIDRKIVLRANPYYYGGKQQITQAEFDVIVDESTAAHLFESGKVDILTRISALDFPRLKKLDPKKVGRIYTGPFLATYYLSFNLQKPPFQNREWRRAVSAAVDRAEIAESTGVGEMPARSWIPPGIDGYLPYDKKSLPDFASEMALVKSQTSQKGAQATGPIRAEFDTSARNLRVMEIVQQNLKKKLGMEVSLQNLDWRAYGKSIQTDPAPIYRYGWLSPMMDPITHLTAFTTGNPNNHSRYSNPKYDLWVKEIEALAPGPERSKKIGQAQKLLVDDDVAVVPIFHYVQNTAVSARIKNFKVSPFGVIRLNELGLSGATN